MSIEIFRKHIRNMTSLQLILHIQAKPLKI
jgi:hypothetical protein